MVIILDQGMKRHFPIGCVEGLDTKKLKLDGALVYGFNWCTGKNGTEELTMCMKPFNLCFSILVHTTMMGICPRFSSYAK